MYTRIYPICIYFTLHFLIDCSEINPSSAEKQKRRKCFFLQIELSRSWISLVSGWYPDWPSSLLPAGCLIIPISDPRIRNAQLSLSIRIRTYANTRAFAGHTWQTPASAFARPDSNYPCTVDWYGVRWMVGRIVNPGAYTSCLYTRPKSTSRVERSPIAVASTRTGYISGNNTRVRSGESHSGRII